jgi:hypothetical protein
VLVNQPHKVAINITLEGEKTPLASHSIVVGFKADEAGKSMSTLNDNNSMKD